jgi:predicted RNA binding protein YcfA (HicA-like mRNA interferase family)
MGARLPVVSGREAAKAFEKLGWHFLRQRGSHMVYGKPDVPANLSIPDHAELSRGTLRSLIRTAGTTVEEFTATLEK